MNIARTVLAPLALSLAAMTGCGSTTPSTSGTAMQPLPAITEYFFGDGNVKGPNGEDYGATKTVARRTVDPATNSAHEDVVSVTTGQPAREYLVDYAIEGSTFTMVEEGGAFTGTGDLVGDAWRWNEWRSHAILAQDQGTVDSDDHESKGSLDATKTYYQHDGSVGALITEHLVAVSSSDFDAHRAELLKP